MAIFRVYAKALAEQDYSYTAKRLRKLYLTAKQFPPAQRRQDIPWHVYIAAGTPENLQPILDNLKQLGWPMTEAHAECVAAFLRKEAPGKPYCERVYQWMRREEIKARRANLRRRPKRA